jgi:hypothetical protein
MLSIQQLGTAGAKRRESATTAVQETLAVMVCPDLVLKAKTT